jgi:cytoskeletal protein CcmA (bactofilin family)
MFGKRKQQNAKQQWKEPTATPPAGESGGEPERAAAETAPRQSAQTPETRPVAQPAPSQPAPSQPAPAQPAKPMSAKSEPAKPLARQPATPQRPDTARRPAASTAPASRSAGQGEPVGEEGRKLIVGKDIALSGEIRSCDKLIVEGTVEAKLTDSEALEVTDNGIFKGTAVIDTADIAGRFEGDLTVRERLYVRASGQVNGTIRYKALEIEGGGRIGGTMTELSAEEAQRLREAEAEAADGGAAPAASGHQAGGQGAELHPVGTTSGNALSR